MPKIGENGYFKDNLCYTEDHIVVETLFVYNIPAEMTKEDLLGYFNVYGRVVSLNLFGKGKNRHLPQRRSNNNCNAFWQEQKQQKSASVFYANPEDAAKALQSQILKIQKFDVRPSDSWHQPQAYGPSISSYGELGQSHIMKLPDNCLLKIMTLLPLIDQIHFQRVCKRFRHVYCSRTQIRFCFRTSPLFNWTLWDTRDFLMLSGKYIESFEGIIPIKRRETFCNMFGSNLVNLKTFIVKHGRVYQRDLLLLLAKTSKLETLVLEECELTDASLTALKNLKNLKYLSLYSNPELTGAHLNELSPTIEVLNLTGCKQLKPTYISQFCRSLYNLRDLNIMISSDQLEFEDVAKLPNLQNIDITFLPNVSIPSSFIEQLVAFKSQQLKQLKIYEANLMTLPTLLQITKLSGLQSLLLDNVNVFHDDVVAEFTKLKKLEKIILQNCVNISNDGVSKLIIGCPKLGELHMQSCPSQKLVQDVIREVGSQIILNRNERKLPIQLHVHFTKEDTPMELRPVVTNKNIIKISYYNYILHLLESIKDFKF